MELLTDYDTYKGLLLRNKKLYRRGFNNNYLSIEAIKRYINKGLMYFEEDSSGIQLFLDEKRYYRCILMIDPNTEFVVHKKDKPVFIRNIYDINRKTDSLQLAENGLERNNFKRIDTSVQIVCRPQDKEEEYRKNNERCLRFLSRFGIKIEYPDKSYAAKAHELRNNTPELKYYQFPYEELSEIEEDFEKGLYRCAIDIRGDLVGVQRFFVENGTLQGDWLAVKEEFRVKYGIGRAMAYNSFVYAIDCGCEMYYGWVLNTNTESLNYHKSIGYELTDKRADEWMLI